MNLDIFHKIEKLRKIVIKEVGPSIKNMIKNSRLELEAI
jgi:hypothetical protein